MGGSWSSTGIIFLDVDGVLNNQGSRTSGDVSGSTPSPPLLQNLAKIFATIKTEINCRIVVSSTWRLLPGSMENLRTSLESVGLEIYDVTPDLGWRGDRVDEILAWREQYESQARKWCEIVAWVVIDDMDLLKMNDKLRKENFVRTDDREGLTDEMVSEAISKLSTQYHESRSSW